jgi:hypothetical protein
MGLTTGIIGGGFLLLAITTYVLNTLLVLSDTVKLVCSFMCLAFTVFGLFFVRASVVE